MGRENYHVSARIQFSCALGVGLAEPARQKGGSANRLAENLYWRNVAETLVFRRRRMKTLATPI